MKNKEKFAKEIVDIVCDGLVLAMNMNTKRLCMCNIDCENCYFCRYNYPHNQGDCTKNFVHWVNSEYKKKRFSNIDKALVKGLDKLNWFARNKDGEVYGYVDKPFKDVCLWDVKPGADGNYALDRVSSYTSATFEPLSWDDEEPVHRSEILGE